MEISNNQNKAKLLKASISEFIGPLLKRLELAEERVSKNSEMVKIIDKIRTKVVKTKDSLDRIQNWDRELIGQFGKIERQIDSWIDHNDKIAMNEITVWNELSDTLDKLSQIPTEKATDLPQEAKKADVRSSQEKELSVDLRDLEELDVHSSLCLYSLGIFPESTELKKRFVIYWWTGLGLLPWFSWEKAELRGHVIFSDLVNKGFLKSVHVREHNQIIDGCTINPTIHNWLLSANERNDHITYDKREDFISPFFGEWFNTKVLVNLDQRYLNPKEIKEIIDNGHLQVVQLGNWHSTKTNFVPIGEKTNWKKTMSNDNIEVKDIAFFKKMGQKITYLSLQGISKFQEVHESLGKLETLMILDLRDCYNLIKLPQKSRSTLKQKLIGWKLPQKSWLKKLIGWDLSQESWFKKLMILDISNCYLLDYMPKWICELPNLEVLKGFVVGRMGNKNQFCRLSDISKLKKLRKLTIRIAREHLVTEDFSGLKPLQTLLVLTIIWEDNKCNSTIPANYFPENLEKLDIRCYPEAEASEMLNPTELKNLKRLYIRGGKLTKISCNEKWKVEILRLRYLKNLVPSDWNDLRSSFENLRYVEYVECSRPKNFPNDGSSWRLQDSLGEQNVVESTGELDSLSFSEEIEERVDHPRKEENLTQEIAPIIKKGLFFGDGMIEKDMDPTGITRIVKIIIHHSNCIDGLIVYFECNGTKQCTDLWGKNYGYSTTEINLKTNEYITSIKGHMDSDYDDIYYVRVQSLVLETNLVVYGPYGYNTGESFEFPALGGQIIGFHGYFGSWVKALGVYVRQSSGSIIKKGPFWGTLEKDMDPTGITRIVKISIYHGAQIYGLTVYFVRNGTTECTDLWGRNEGTLIEINLKPNEYIKSVKGYWDPIRGSFGTLKSLVLETNLAVYGPYGKEEGKSFEHTADRHGQIIGFYALVGIYVHNIGVYVQTSRTIKKGPFGGLGGLVKDIDLAGITRIVKIIIRHSNVIDALTVYFERNGTTVCTNQWGGNGGNLSEIKLETNEYITYVKGYFNNNYDGHEVVMSLVLKTNLAVYGPYGTENGESFELSALHEKIIGFHTRHGEYVNAVGVYVQKTGPIILKRPFGGDNKTWNVMYPRDNIRIVKIDIRHGDLIDALIVHFECNGIPQIPDRWGRNGGNLSEIPLETNEYITSVKGYISDTENGPTVSSLKLETNLRIYGPYGRENGESFELTALHGKIIGFYGCSSSEYLDAVGVYIRDLKRKLVLCGGNGGLPKDMDLTGVTRIVKVSIRHSDAIDALFVCFDRNGTIEQTSHWGGKTGALDKIDLKPNEYITSVRGYVGYVGDLFIVRSLELITNLEGYGPYGKEEGTPFELSAHGGQIIGFHGRSGAYLDAIGVYICPVA